jgi:Asp-tRNA(Asn)/Glu-tRNA(Gln) amidotransferase A subunit family amidase
MAGRQDNGMRTNPPPLADATELLRQMRDAETTAEAVMLAHLARLREAQPRHNAATRILADSALEQARHPRPGPLTGLPLSVKETFDIGGEPVTLGSRRRRPTIPSADADVVQRLRDAGAIVVARSNVPELAMAGETDNLRFGRTHNALDPGRTAGGSSGGEAVLVASGASAIGIGSDILGSIRIPAAFNGIVGFKPASGSVCKRGTWPRLGGSYLDSWLAIGPLVRSVRDARLVANVILETPLPPPAPIDRLRLIVPDGFHLRIVDPAIEQAVQRAERVLTGTDIKVVHETFPDIPALFGCLQRLVAHELERPLRDELSSSDGTAFSLWQELWRQLQRRPTIYGGLFQLLLVAPLVRPRSTVVPGIIATLQAARRRYQAMLGDDGILLLPTLGRLAPRHGRMNRDSLRPGVNGTMTPVTFPNLMDLPSITLPSRADRDEATGLVPAVMLCAAPGAEGALLDAAEALEAGMT